jgi:hypothetical protein
MIYTAKGEKVVKILSGGGIETASIQVVSAICQKRDLLSIDPDISKPKDIQADGVQTYRLSDGRAAVNYINGFSSRLVDLEE